MSLIITTVTPSGIIAAADTRTTIKRDKDIAYFDETQKVFGVYGRAAILTCGDNMVTPNITVQSLIGRYIKEEVEPGKISIKTIAYGLLSKTLILNDNADITYLIAGYESDGEPYVYRVYTKDKECRSEWEPGKYGASFGGITDICSKIMTGCIYDSMNLENALMLTQCALQATNISCKLKRSQGVGPLMDIYIIDKSDRYTGWFTHNHEPKLLSFYRQPKEVKL